MRDFRKIMAWEKADELVVLIYEASRAFPKEERYGLTSQLRRAAVSVAANIAEGSGKQYLKEFRQFLYTARASFVRSGLLHSPEPSARLPQWGKGWQAGGSSPRGSQDIARLYQRCRKANPARPDS
jgi:hypothetical protein